MDVKNIINKDGTITISDTVIENPTLYPVPKYVYREYKEGKTTYKELWVDGYSVIDKANVCWSYKLSITNRGKTTFDDKNVKTEDQDKIKYIFDNIKVNS